MGELVKGQIGKEDMEVQCNTNASETFTRTSSTGGTLSLTKIPDIWNGSGKIKVAQIEGDLTGDITGDVTGDVTGDLTGNVTGNLTGSITGCTGLLADDQHVLDSEVQAIKLDDFAAPDDNTDLDASTVKHGLLPKLDGLTTTFLRGDGTWAGPGIGEGHITILPWHYSGITQGTWAIQTNASNILNGWFRNTSDAQNDQIDYKAFLAAGTYTFVTVGYAGTSQAILTLLFDGVSQGTQDRYDAAELYNVIKTTTGIVVSTSGLKTISFKAATRNGSSAGWFLSISCAVLFRTA